MILKEIFGMKNVIEMEIVYSGVVVVEVDRMGYFWDYYFFNLVSKVGLDFDRGTKVLKYSMLVHYLHKMMKIEYNLVNWISYCCTRLPRSFLAHKIDFFNNSFFSFVKIF